MAFLKYLIDIDNLPVIKRKKVFLIGALILSIVVGLSFIFLFAPDHPFVMFFLISVALGLGVAIVYAWLILVAYSIISSIYLIRKHPRLWIQAFFRISLEERYYANQQIRRLEDSFLRNLGTWLGWFSRLFYVVWFVAFVFFFFIFFVVKPDHLL